MDKIYALAQESFDTARPTPANAHRAGVLTDREREVASLVAEAYDDKTIAGTLSISYRTVRKHVQNILLKIGIEEARGDHRRDVRDVSRVDG